MGYFQSQQTKIYRCFYIEEENQIANNWSFKIIIFAYDIGFSMAEFQESRISSENKT